MKNAIISAAGWKGAGWGIDLEECPEPFLPFGDGTTALYRTAEVLSENDYTVYIAIGKRGYPYSRYIRWSATKHLPYFKDSFPWDGSPWTQARYDYAASLGEVVEIEDPGGWSTSLDTLCAAMDIIGQDKWDHLFLTCGDMIVPRECFEYILSCELPFMFSFTAFHVCFGLNRPGAEFFREYTDPFRRFKSEESWFKDKALSPSYQGIEILKKAGFQHVQLDTAPECKWVDIDIAQNYRKACSLVERTKE